MTLNTFINHVKEILEESGESEITGDFSIDVKEYEGMTKKVVTLRFEIQEDKDDKRNDEKG